MRYELRTRDLVLNDWVHWQQCKGVKPRVLIDISHGEVIDWSPYSFPERNYSHSALTN